MSKKYSDEIKKTYTNIQKAFGKVISFADVTDEELANLGLPMDEEVAPMEETPKEEVKKSEIDKLIDDLTAEMEKEDIEKDVKKEIEETVAMLQEAKTTIDKAKTLYEKIKPAEAIAEVNAEAATPESPAPAM